MKRKLKLRVKITLLVILSIITFSAFIWEVQYSTNVTQTKKVPYTKVSSLKYVTHLKDGGTKDDGYNLVGNLIDYFSLDYNYAYTLNEKIKYKLTYNIDALLEVYDKENDAKPIEKKSFKIYDEVTEKGNSQTINVNIFSQKIIYDTYNQIVQEWKKEISPNANLTISINVSWTGHSKTLGRDITDESATKLVIPISQRTIEIKPADGIDETGEHTRKEKLPWWYIVIIMSTLSIFVVELIYLISTANSKNKSKYEQKINKILREFDRAITEANGVFTKDEDTNYIEVKDFMELLDVHDNVNEPIIYYKNNEDLSVFVVKTGHDTYYSLVRRSDLDD